MKFIKWKIKINGSRLIYKSFHEAFTVYKNLKRDSLLSTVPYPILMSDKYYYELKEFDGW